jgi:hypothetical protein
MGNRIDTRVILGSLRYKSAPDTNLMFNVPLIQTAQINVEFDRNIDVSLEQVFDDERQKSDIFRPTCKFSLLFNNSYTGSTNYQPFENNMYYINEAQAAADNCTPTGINPNVIWSGLPQYNEFDFIRTDYDVPGYTQPPYNHLTFVSKSASTYNWNHFISYPFENDYQKQLQAVTKIPSISNAITLDWIASDGIPFVIENDDTTVYNGRNIIKFICPMKHGLTPGEFVKLNFGYNNVDTFEVYSLGDGKYESDLYIFNIFNVGFTGTTFTTGTEGTFRRIINNDNPSDTISTYYVRRHKILTNPENAILVNAGFDQNIFGVKRKYESSGFTPNRIARVSIKEGAQSYTLSFDKDVRINDLIDNQKRPLTELFFTTIWKGYFGYMFGRLIGPGMGYQGMKFGYDFNLPLNPQTKLPTDWWSEAENLSDTNIPIDTYVNTTLGPNGLPLGEYNGAPIVFTYNRSLKEGDTLDGDYCEWNNFEQTERVISNLYHKITYNAKVFNIGRPISSTGYRMSLTNPFGYYYQPHNSLTIRQFSDYIEEGNKKNVVDVPNYAYYSPSKDTFLWKDLYSYGFVDSNGIGVNYPFLNGAHYPYANIIFRIIPEGTNYNEQIITAEPIIDDCE